MSCSRAPARRIAPRRLFNSRLHGRARCLVWCPTLCLTAALLVGCEEPPPWQTDAALEPLCERVLQCGGWGYVDPGECEDALVGNPALGTACDDEDAYLSCMHDCCWQACRQTRSRDECCACQPPDCNQCEPLVCEDLEACDAACFAEHCAGS